MPRSSRHKSSKHGSRDAGEYSESEDDLGAKERKGENDEEGGRVNVSKHLVLSEKRKLDGKESRRDGYDGRSGNGGEYAEDYDNSSSKRSKERESGDAVSDRWNGGGENAEEKGDGSRKARGSGESKISRRREDGSDEMKKSGRSEKHGRESNRKEGKKERERDVERERDRDRHRERDRERDKDRERERDKEKDRDSEKKGKEGKGEKFIDNVDERLSSNREIATDSKAGLHVRNCDPDDIFERQNRKRSENPANKYQEDIGDVKSKHAPSVDDVMKGRRKDEKRRDEKYRDEIERSRQDKYNDDYPMKHRSRSRSREKYPRDDNDRTDVKQKKMKPREGDQENDFHSSYDHNRHRDRDQGRDVGHERDGYRKREQVSGGDRDCNPVLDKERERDRDYNCERERDHVHDQETDSGHYDERSGRDKDHRGRRTSPDEQDEYSDSKARGSKALSTDFDKVSLNNRIEANGGGDVSRSRSANVDISPSNRRWVSPTPSSFGDDGYRKTRPEDLKYRDLQMENRLKANAAEATERSSKRRSSEKHNKTDDGMMELLGERSATSKPSRMGLTDGSPSPSLDKKYMNRSGARRSFDVEDVGRRSVASADSRDFSVAEGKSGGDIGVDKPMVEEPSQADSSFGNRLAQGNMNPLPPSFRLGIESPTFMGMMEEDSRPNLSSRYKRTSDPGVGRGHMSSWRGMPNWPAPLPNGFMPYQSGLPHGNFPPIMPHFPSPPIFGFRPPMEINQPSMPFPLADTDRFPGNPRPLGWPNMIDPSGPPRLHGWDVNNGVWRGESHLFGAGWEHNRHPINAREWESNVDMWKGHNGSSADLPSASNKDSTRVQFTVEDGFAGQWNRKSYNENGHEGSEQKGVETRPVLSPGKTSTPSSEGPIDRKQVSTKVGAIDNIMSISQFYLSKLDISEELAHPEVYRQCIDLVDGNPGLTVDDDPSARIILTIERRGPRTSDDSLCSSVLPTTDDSSFQKALELYKNQRLEIRDVAMVKIDPLDLIVSTHYSNDMNPQDGVGAMNEEKVASDMDEELRLQSTVLTSDPGKFIDGTNTGKDDTVDESGMESSPQNVCGSKTEASENWENPKTIPVNHATRSNDIPQATSPEADAAMAIQPRVDDIIIATKTETSGKVGSDSVVGGGPSEACEAVSNESELINYGRIHHHSPESTH